MEVCAQRAEQELGWRARTAFTDGVARYVDWHRAEYEEPQEPAIARPADARGPWRVLAGLPLRLAAAVPGRAPWRCSSWPVAADASRPRDVRTLGSRPLGLTVGRSSSPRAHPPPRALSSEPELLRPADRLRRDWRRCSRLVMALLGPYNPHHLAGPDFELLALSFIGAGLGVGTGAVGRRARRERLRERASDTS